ncbi:MAG TPA: hypothetical protein VHS81_13755 [Caulobacteraceae bacterium]|jgi:hypothetical protein|nr:hypothetical protein [Caulobacteraceae bacterium]
MVSVGKGPLAGLLALVGFVACAQTASAQSYNFSYTGTDGGGDILTLIATMTGTNCSSTCLPSSGSGTLTVVSPGNVLTPGTYALSYDPSNFTASADNLFNANSGVDFNGIDFETTIPGNGATVFSFYGDSDPADGSGGVENNVTLQDFPGSTVVTGTFDYSAAAAPAPAPVAGAGPWSWLALSILGLFLCRKRLAAWGRASIARLAPSGA